MGAYWAVCGEELTLWEENQTTLDRSASEDKHELNVGQSRGQSAELSKESAHLALLGRRDTHS